MANTFFVNKRDLDFVLFEQLKIQDLQSTDRYADFEKDDYAMMLEEVIRFCTEVIAPLNSDSDRIGATFADGQVTSPPGFIEAWQASAENGWVAPVHSPEYGGMGLPTVMGALIQEIFMGACTSFQLNMGLCAGAGHLVEAFGTDEQKAMYVEKLYTGEWAGTMVLTEPGAGSDLAQTRTVAKEVQGEDYFKIEGTKLFITAGEHDLAPNIIHAVLAKMPGEKVGTRSLGLFVVPKVRVGEDGSLGDFNDVICAGIEHKMGIHGSPTCVLQFGENDDCHGWLLGTVPYQGIKQMFQMMNEARIMTGMQGIGLSAVAYENAVRFAKDRLQGSDITTPRDKTTVPIIKHADVRRMLMLQKSHVEGMRALAYGAAVLDDRAKTATDPELKMAMEERLALMTPIVKAFCTDKGFEMCNEAIQVFGGYGYCGEYPVEQYARDARIAPIYEGTNFIQSADLLARKMPRNGGAAFQAVMADVTAFVDAYGEVEELKVVCEMVGKARDGLLGAVGSMMKNFATGDFNFPMSIATRFLHMMGELICGWQLGEQAALAKAALDAGATGDDEVFYKGKLITARFFAQNVLPGVRMKAAIIKAGDTSCLEMAEEAF
jgi:alkylation response protein AidB-like acyl-CoA dehydrogenase